MALRFHPSLPQVASAAVIPTRRLARFLHRTAPRLEEARHHLAELLGMPEEELSLSAGEVQQSPTAAPAGVTAVVLSSDLRPGDTLVLEISTPLAKVIVDRMLGGLLESPAEVSRAADGTSLQNAERGVLAYVVARLLAPFGVPWSVATVLTTRRALLRAIKGVLGAEASVTAIWGLRARQARGGIRLWITEGTQFPEAAGAPPDASSAEQSAEDEDVATASRAGATPVPLCLDAAEAMVPASKLMALCTGDAFLFEAAERFARRRVTVRSAAGGGSAWWLGEKDMVIQAIEARPGPESDALTQSGGVVPAEDQAVLASASMSNDETHPSEDASSDDLFAAGSELEEEATAIETDGSLVSDSERSAHVATGLAQVGEVPVCVSLELARFTLPLAELGKLVVGDVFSTGAATQGLARLRVGDAVVAEGELVEIDGDLGVRITRLNRS